MTRIMPRRAPISNDKPFSGDGVSLYANAGNAVTYRNKRVLVGTPIRGSGGTYNPGTSMTKTARVASAASPTEEIAWNIPSAFASGNVAMNVRRYKDNVENETSYGEQIISLDGSLDPVDTIQGTATLLTLEKRDGGVVRIRFAWAPAADGVTATKFTAVRTAGPTSPADATVTITDETLIEIDTPALSDASTYTFKITAANSDDSVTKDVLTGISVTADATGPVVPIQGGVSVV